ARVLRPAERRQARAAARPAHTRRHRSTARAHHRGAGLAARSELVALALLPVDILVRRLAVLWRPRAR
ncbi:MAG TPA: hypothetical protein PLO33_16860, partial [Kouleothrix sp.]|nr:hypothetical protein [Kouleothrix sp.]